MVSVQRRSVVSAANAVCVSARVVISHQMDEVNDELLKRITTNKSQPPARNFRVERSGGSSIPLTFDSSPQQVTAWLTAKFSKP